MKENIHGSFGVRVKKDWKRNRSLYIMFIPVVLFYVMFMYKPMYGVIIAFMDYAPAKGIWGSKWVGLKHFERFFTGPYFGRLLRNTLLLSLYSILFCFTTPIILALLLNEVHCKKYKSVAQTLSYLPHFVSWILLAGIFTRLLSSSGIVNRMLNSLGISSIIFLGDNKWFPFTIISTHIWKEFGYGTIVYLAAVAGVNTDLYEAAQIDGAGHWKQLVHITLPSIVPIIILMTTLSLGNILNAGFDQVFNLYNTVVYESGDIIDTLVYRIGFGSGQFGLSSTAGLFKSLVSAVLVVVSYRVAYRTSGYRVF